MNHSQALRLALDALGKFSIGYHVDAVELNDLIATLEAALEQPEQTNYTEEKLQAVAKYVGDKYHVWYGIGARDVEEVLRQSARLGLVTLNSDTVEQLEQEPVAWVEKDGELVWCDKARATGRNLYIRPPRREWRGLTEEVREQATGWSVEHIEAALKELNA
jgi:hypothetical protein